MTHPTLPFARRTLLGSGAASIALPAVLRAQPAAVKLGILQPVTGALAQDGELGRLGAQLAVDEINAAGGLKALGGAKVEMVFADARSNPEAATQEVERLQGEGVAAVVGGYASPICLAASQVAARYGLPYVVDVGVADQIVQRGLSNKQRIQPKGVYCVLNGAASNYRFVREFPEAADGVVDCNHWAGSAGREKVIAALAAPGFSGHIMPYGPTKFVNGQNQGAAPVNTQVQDRDIKVIFPAEFADAKPVFPAKA